MDMNWLESLIFGLVSGLTELLPVSAQAHEALLLKLIGAGESAQLRLLRLAVHAAVLAALYVSLAEQIGHLLRERKLARIPPRRRKRQPDMQWVLDLRLMQTALIPLLLSFLAYQELRSWQTDLSKTALLLLMNGIILYVSGHMRTGNKDSRSMSQLDGLIIGAAGGLSVLPGISRVGAMTSAGLARGADRENSLRWALLLCIPAMLGLICFDVYALVTMGIGTVSFALVIQTVLAAAAAFGGAAIGIAVMKFLAVRTGFSGFAYYCWGAALFSFLMYLTV